MKKTLSALALGAALTALLPGCSTNTRGDDASPVFLAGNFQELPLSINVASGAPLQFRTTVLQARLKTTNVASLQFLDTQVDSYVVRWTRLDGGTKASAQETFGGNAIVPPNGTTTLNNYPYMSADALIRSPLDQLFPFNGGIDHETGKAEIRQAGHVTWYGHTLSGQPVISVEATFDMMFFYSGAAGRVQGKLVR